LEGLIKLLLKVEFSWGLYVDWFFESEPPAFLLLAEVVLESLDEEVGLFVEVNSTDLFDVTSPPFHRNALVSPMYIT